MVLPQGDLIVKPIRLAGERGQILIITALGMIMLLGVAGLSIDASYMYDKRNKLFAAADAAAKSGALEVYRDLTLSSAALTAYGNQQVTAQLAGFDPAGATSVTIRRCTDAGATCSPPFSTDNRYVEAIVSEVTSTFFGNILGFVSANPGARAVAGYSSGPNCIVTFDHISLPISSGVVNMPNCSLVVGGSTSPTAPATSDLNTNVTINARNIGVVHTGGTGCDAGGVCSNVTYGVTPPGDPLASLVPLPDPADATCTVPFDLTADTTISATLTDRNKYYCGINFHGGILTLNPGNYYINGPLTAQNPGTDVVINEVSPGGVMLYLTSGAGRLNLNSNHVVMSITAPVSPAPPALPNPYSGILFYQDRNTPVGTVALFGKNLTEFAVRGAFYFPTANIQMHNQNTITMSNPCTLIVAWAIEVDKPDFDPLDNTCSVFGGSPLLTVSLAE